MEDVDPGRSATYACRSMPDWLTLPRLLLCAVPAAMLLAANALAAGERRAAARRAREALGHPAARVEGGTTGERVVLVGRLEVVHGPCERFDDGAPAAAATVEASGAGAAAPGARPPVPSGAEPEREPFIARTARAAELVLVAGEERVVLSGPVDVHVGSHETAPDAPFSALAPAVRERIALVAGAGALPGSAGPGPVLARPVLRSIHPGARVRAAGVLVRRSDGDRAGYRDPARHCLTGDETTPIALAYEGTPRFSGALTAVARGVRPAPQLRAALLAAVVLGALALLAALQHRSSIQPDVDPRAPASPAEAHRPHLADPGECAALEKAHAAALAKLTACSADDECLSERRGGAVHGLEGCYRFRNRGTSTHEADRIQQKWMNLGCAAGYELCPAPPPAMCSRGRCVGRPPSPIPETWQRHDEPGAFSFYLPPAMERVTPSGDGSTTAIYRGGGVEISTELGPVLDDDSPEGEPASARIGGSGALYWKLPREITITFDRDIACSFPGCPSRDAGTRLTAHARCDTDAACDEAWLALQSVRFW